MTQPPLADPEVTELLSRGRLTVAGRLRTASNVTLVVDVAAPGRTMRAVYKPVSGERPLWDFPDGTLAGREVAAHLVAAAAGSSVVPVTVMREDAPFGRGSLQAWVDSDGEEPGEGLVDLVAPGALPAGWRAVLAATGARGEDVLLVHAGDARLREVAVLDIVLNNADRKGGHLFLDSSGQVRGVDHGLVLHREDKLRTVLWGWAGEALTGADRALLERLAEQLRGMLPARLSCLVTRGEVDALQQRVAGLLAAGVLPEPAGSWPAIPWPAF